MGKWRVHIPDEVRQAVKQRDGNACLLCGATDELTMDHIKPLYAGGTNDMSNLQTLCATCNEEKGSKYSGIPDHDHRRNKTDRAMRDLQKIFGPRTQRMKRIKNKYKK